MDVVSAQSLRASSVLWQGTTRVLTVVCKVTFALAPGESTLAPDPEGIHEHDTFVGDDPAGSIVAPSDLVPFKGRADVILVGTAFAPRGEPVRSLVARMIVGELDKAIEVHQDRAWSREGAIHEGARFTSMPLGYERAAGGPEGSNPVGVRADARPNTYGMAPLPNLQPPGLQISSRADAIPVVGFGPIAPTWPSRREKLGRHAATWNPRTWNQAPLPRDIEPAYFNSAPRDQQVDELRIDERIILENLHPEVPRLITRLPGMRPRAFVDLGNRSPQPEIALLCETLWIDSARSICTLTFRGHLESPPPNGRVIIGLERAGQRLTFADVEQQIRVEPERSPASRKIETPAAPPTTWNRSETLAFVGGEHGLAAKGGAVLPFGSSGAPKARSAAAELLGDKFAPPSAPLTPFVPSPPPSAPFVPRPVVPPPMTVGQAAAQSAIPMAIVAPTAAVTAAPTPVSNDPRQIWAGKALQLVWFDPDSLPRIHRKEEFKPILRALEERPPESDLDDPSIARNPGDVEDRRDVFEVLSHGDALDEAALTRALERAVRDDGKFVPPLALVDGEVRFFFDELETLRATLTIAAVFSPGDEPLKAAIADAREFLRTPDLRSPPSVTEGYTTRVQEALKRVKRAITPTYLDEQTERVLVEARRYQRRTVYGAPHLRAQLQIGNAARPWPLYVAEAAATRLPMFARFTARILAEVSFQENQYDPHPSALRVLAIGRVTPTSGKHDRDG